MLENKRKSRQNDDFAKCGWGGWMMRHCVLVIFGNR